MGRRPGRCQVLKSIEQAVKVPGQMARGGRQIHSKALTERQNAPSGPGLNSAVAKVRKPAADGLIPDEPALYSMRLPNPPASRPNSERLAILTYQLSVSQPLIAGFGS